MDWVTITIGVFFLVSIVIGIYRGAVRIAISLMTAMLTLIIVVFVSPYLTDMIQKYTPMDEMIKDKVESVMLDAATQKLLGEEAGDESGGISEDSIRQALKAAGISEEQLEQNGISVTDIAQGKITGEQLAQFGISSELLKGHMKNETAEQPELDVNNIPRDMQQEAIGAADLPKIFKKLLMTNNNDEIYTRLGVENFIQYVGSFLAKLIIHLIAFLGSYLIITIIMRAIVFALDIISSFPVLGLVNRLLGGAVGAFVALIVVWLLFIVLTLLYTTPIGKQIYDSVQGNSVLKIIYDYNPVMILATKYM